MSVGCEFWLESIGVIFHDDGTVWLMRKDGEGMEVDPAKLEELLVEWFAENF